MSGYGFGKRPVKPTNDTLDLSGITRAPLPLDPEREAAAIARGTALGFVDRAEPDGTTRESGVGEGTVRRRRQAVPQASLFIKGPKETLDWFIDFTNQRGHRSYWQALAELRELAERGDEP